MYLNAVLRIKRGEGKTEHGWMLNAKLLGEGRNSTLKLKATARAWQRLTLAADVTYCHMRVTRLKHAAASAANPVQSLIEELLTCHDSDLFECDLRAFKSVTYSKNVVPLIPVS